MGKYTNSSFKSVQQSSKKIHIPRLNLISHEKPKSVAKKPIGHQSTIAKNIA